MRTFPVKRGFLVALQRRLFPPLPCGSKATPRQARFQPTVETLETRMLLSASAPMPLISAPLNSAPMISADIPMFDRLTLPAVTFMRRDGYQVEQPWQDVDVSSREELAQFLLDRAVLQWRYLFGQPDWRSRMPRLYESIDVDDLTLRNGWTFTSSMPQMTSFAIDASVDGSMDYSRTNIQVEGVDEADIVRTDGDYLYIVRGRELIIVDALPADSMNVVSRTELPGRVVAQYLFGNRLTVISNVMSEPYSQSDDWASSDRLIRPYHTQTNRLQVTVFDVSDRAAPQILQETLLDGRYVDSRAIDGKVYLAIHGNLALPRPKVIRWIDCDDSNIAGHETRYRYETEAEYRERVADRILELALPSLYRRNVGSDEPFRRAGFLVEPESLLGSIPRNFSNLVTIAVLDATGESAEPLDTVNIFSSFSPQVYMTTDNLYVLSAQHESTLIHKIRFDGHHARVVAQGTVEGRVLNQFSVDEHEGHLRVATNTGSGWGAEWQNHVFVLKQRGHRLEMVGSLTNLAPGEKLYSARFMGDRAFLVTFIKVDPLFALDLSDPTNPRVVGELKIPGYSDYLQPISEDYLIGIGRNADENIGRFQQFQVSLFNVSDMANPTLVDRYEFAGGRSTWSDALIDHHAVSYFPEYQTLAIPFYSRGGRGGFFFGVDNTPIFTDGLSGLAVLRIDVDAGFELAGEIVHDARVDRSLRIGELIYSMSYDTIKVHEMDDPSSQHGEVIYVDQGLSTPQHSWGGVHG